MMAPTWAEIAERAKLLLWQKLRELRRWRRHRRFARRSRPSDLADLVKRQGIEAQLKRQAGQVMPYRPEPKLSVLRDPHGEYGYIDGGYRGPASGREAWEREEYPHR